MITWFLIGLYLLGYGACWRRLSGQIAWHCFATDRRSYPISYRDAVTPSGENWFGAILGATLFSFVWPLSLVVAYGVAGNASGGKMLYIPPQQRERMYKERIRELEREVGINAQ